MKKARIIIASAFLIAIGSAFITKEKALVRHGNYDITLYATGACTTGIVCTASASTACTDLWETSGCSNRYGGTLKRN